MEKAGKKKMDRQEERRVLYDSMIYDEKTGRVKDFCRFVKDCTVELDSLKGNDRVFYRWLVRKYRDHVMPVGDAEISVTVSDYLEWAAQELASHMDGLDRWNTGESWKLPVDRGTRLTMWKQTLEAWWTENRFPFVAKLKASPRAGSEEQTGSKAQTGNKDVKLLCSRRDVVIYVLMTLGFTVEESDEFLAEMCLVKDRPNVRQLYVLDYKEGLFRWIMRWNENHPEQGISYQAACDMYEKYSRYLFEHVTAQNEKVLKEIAAWRNFVGMSMPSEEALGFLDELEKGCKDAVSRLPEDGNGYFNENTAEDLKRAMAVVVHAERSLKRRKQEWEKNLRLSRSGRLEMIRKRNDDTRMDRGSSYVWMELSRLADPAEKNLESAFEAYQEQTVDYLYEAHWKQFSVLMKLYAKSGENSEAGARFVTPIRFAESSEEPRVYKDANLFDERRKTILSFAYDGGEVSDAINSGTANGMYISDLLNPVPRNDRAIFSLADYEGDTGFSELKNNYEKWCSGGNEPFKEYKRERIMKLALAAGVETIDGLKEAMWLAGSGEFNLLDRGESMVYLAARYREEVKLLIKKTKEQIYLADSAGKNEALREKTRARIKRLSERLPKELTVTMPASVDDRCTDAAWNNWICALDDWSVDIQDEKMSGLLVEDLRKMDLLTVLFEREKDDAETVQKKVFYGPYTKDFVKIFEEASGVRDRALLWYDVELGLERLMGQVLSADAMCMVFELWYEDTKEKSFTEIPYREWRKERNLAELYIKQIRERLEEVFEAKWGASWKVTAKGDGAEFQDCLEALHQAVSHAYFMLQMPNARETKGLLEQWFYLLAAAELLGFDITKSLDFLKIYVFYWFASGGLSNFRYDTYIEDTKWSRIDDAENAGLYERTWKTVFDFWGRIYDDYYVIRASVEWLEEQVPDVGSSFRVMFCELNERIEIGSDGFDSMKRDWWEDVNEARNQFEVFDQNDPEMTEKNKKRAETFVKRFDSFYKSGC